MAWATGQAWAWATLPGRQAKQPGGRSLVHRWWRRRWGPGAGDHGQPGQGAGAGPLCSGGGGAGGGQGPRQPQGGATLPWMVNTPWPGQVVAVAGSALSQGSVDAEWRRCMVCGSRSRAGVWLPGNRGKVPAGLEAVCLGERQGRDVRLSRCEVEVLGAPKNRPELRDSKPEPVNVLERIAYQVGIYRIEKESQDDNGGNPDFEREIPDTKDRLRASHCACLAFRQVVNTPGWVGDSELMGGRAMGAGGGGPHMAAAGRGRRTYPPGPLTLGVRLSSGCDNRGTFPPRDVGTTEAEKR